MGGDNYLQRCRFQSVEQSLPSPVPSSKRSREHWIREPWCGCWRWKSTRVGASSMSCWQSNRVWICRPDRWWAPDGQRGHDRRPWAVCALGSLGWKRMRSWGAVSSVKQAAKRPPGHHGEGTPWWWCLLGLCVVCFGLAWLSSLVVCRQVRENNLKGRLWVWQSGPARLAPYQIVINDGQ